MAPVHFEVAILPFQITIRQAEKDCELVISCCYEETNMQPITNHIGLGTVCMPAVPVLKYSWLNVVG